MISTLFGSLQECSEVQIEIIDPSRARSGVHLGGPGGFERTAGQALGWDGFGVQPGVAGIVFLWICCKAWFPQFHAILQRNWQVHLTLGWCV